MGNTDWTVVGCVLGISYENLRMRFSGLVELDPLDVSVIHADLAARPIDEPRSGRGSSAREGRLHIVYAFINRHTSHGQSASSAIGPFPELRLRTWTTKLRYMAM